MKIQLQSSSQSLGAKARLLALSVLTVSTFAACGSGGGSGGGEAIQPGPSGSSGTDASKPVPGNEGIGAKEPNYRPRGLSSKVFTSGARRIAPMDMEAQNLTMTFDAKAKTFSGSSIISFHQNDTSRPAFLLDGTVQTVFLNGTAVPFTRVQDPYGNSLVVIDREIEAGRMQVAEVKYGLPSGRVSFTGGGVGFLTDMADVAGTFFDKWGPANFEDDQFGLTLRFVVKNSTSNHRVFANGGVSQVGSSEWVVTYPSDFTSTSFFAHLTNRSLTVSSFNVQGVARSIPVTIYSSDASEVAQAKAKIPGLFREIEADYGPYAHPSFVAYISKSSGGMEYVGATITSQKSLSHELFHSWFARGVMPAEGRAGWIDEAIASWRDHGYARSTSLLARPSTNLANYSAFRRSTPSNSYADGRALMAELDRLFASRGGMKPVLRGLFDTYKRSLITTAELREYLESSTGTELGAYFNRYVYGGATMPYGDVEELAVDSAGAGSEAGAGADARAGSERADAEDSLHPTALTEAELRALR